jgi:arylsulfatase A-like enzyme
MAEVLRRNGYSIAAFGKWHNTPQWETSPLGLAGSLLFGAFPSGLS